MEKFLAVKHTEELIILSNAEDLDKLYNIIMNDENFILQWKDKNSKMSEVMIATHLSGKIKNKELKLVAEEK